MSLGRKSYSTGGNPVVKGWGSEVVFVNSGKYCGKLLQFNAGGTFSMHFHKDKDETWYVLSGKLKFRWIDKDTAKVHEEILSPTMAAHIPQCLAHQLEAMEASVILEVSTPDSHDDNYRVLPGDSQSNKGMGRQ